MHLATFLSATFAASASAVPLSQILASQNDTLSQLNALFATVPGVTQMLSNATNITVLAPSNNAFSKLIAAMPSIADDAMNPQFVTNLLQYHVLSGVRPSSSFTNSPLIASSLLGPPYANVTGGQRVELVQLNGKATALSGFKQPAAVTTADLMFDGGVLHIVDAVLSVPQPAAVTAEDTGLTALAGALQQAGLVAGVQALTDATIFAPSNKAFEAVGDVVGAAPEATLAGVLEYHVLMNQLKFSTDLLAADGAVLTTLAGEQLTVRVEGGEVFINSAKVVVTDIIMANGVIHVIDNVLNPAATTLTPNPSLATQSPAFSGASDDGQVPFTSGINPTTTLIPEGASGLAGPRAMPTAAVLGLLGGAAVLANL